MIDSPTDRRTAQWLDDHVREWVAAGLVSADQAAALRRHEHLDSPAAPPRLTVAAEVASYLASVIAVAGGAAIIGPHWGALTLGGQLALAVAIAAVGFLVGARLVRIGDAGTLRLGWFVWVVATGGAALAAEVVMSWIDPRDDAWFAVVIGLTVAALGGGLWRNRDLPLQMLTTLGGSLATFAGVIELTHVSIWVAAPVTQLASVAVGAGATFGRLRPRLTALMASGVGLMIGSFLYADGSERVAAIAAVTSAALIVWFAHNDRSWPLVGLGLIAFFVGTTSLMQTVLHGTLARLVAVLLGLAVVGSVAVRAQRMGAARRPTDVAAKGRSPGQVAR